MFMRFNDFLERWFYRSPTDTPLTFRGRTLLLGGQRFQLRQATLLDTEVLVAIEAAIYGVPPWNAAAFTADLKRGDRLYLLARQGATAAGLIGLALDASQADGHITNLAVHPSFQHQGLGRCLMQAVTAVSRAQQMMTMSLEVRVDNLAAQRLYRQVGFQVHRRLRHYYLTDGSDAFEMVRVLDRRKEEKL